MAQDNCLNNATDMPATDADDFFNQSLDTETPDPFSHRFPDVVYGGDAAYFPNGFGSYAPPPAHANSMSNPASMTMVNPQLFAVDQMGYDAANPHDGAATAEIGKQRGKQRQDVSTRSGEKSNSRTVKARIQALAVQRYKCEKPGCPSACHRTGALAVFGSKSDLIRHYGDIHGQDKNGNPLKFPCPYKNCKRHAAGNEFHRKVSREEHISKLHGGKLPTGRDAARPAAEAARQALAQQLPPIGEPGPSTWKAMEPHQVQQNKARLPSPEAAHADSPVSPESLDSEEQDSHQDLRLRKEIDDLEQEQRKAEALVKRLTEEKCAKMRERNEFLAEQLRRSRKQKKRARQPHIQGYATRD